MTKDVNKWVFINIDKPQFLRNINKFVFPIISPTDHPYDTKYYAVAFNAEND